MGNQESKKIGRRFLKENRRTGSVLPVHRRRSIWPPLALIALLVGTFAVSCGSGGQRAEAPAGDEPEAAVYGEHPSLGDEGAPVVMTEYADFQ
jgi:hypothetical protein